MLFNRQEGLDIDVPKEVILYYINMSPIKVLGHINNTHAKLSNPSLKYFLELIDQLATVGVENFNIIIYNMHNNDDNIEYFHSTIQGAQAIQFLEETISVHMSSINNRRIINSVIQTQEIEKTTDEIRESSLPKIFMASEPLFLLDKDRLDRNINYLLATEINENSYFIGSRTLPFILKGDSDKYFAHFLMVIKRYLNTPYAYFKSTNFDNASNSINSVNRSLDFDSIDKYGYSDQPNEFKYNINHKLEHELLISTVVNMICKPNEFTPGQFVIIKKLFSGFFDYVTEELDMNLKASSTLIKDVINKVRTFSRIQR